MRMRHMTRLSTASEGHRTCGSCIAVVYCLPESPGVFTSIRPVVSHIGVIRTTIHGDLPTRCSQSVESDGTRLRGYVTRLKHPAYPPDADDQT